MAVEQRGAEGSITVGTAVAEPGATATGVIPVTRLAGGNPVEIPVIVINGHAPGPCLWVDGAIHGDEPEGTLTCHMLRREVDPANLTGSLVLVPAMNVAAYEASRRGNPLDTFGYDMNRVYPGRPDGYLTERISHAHMEWLTEVADMNMALHSGGEHSFLSAMVFVSDHQPSQELARALGEDFSLALSAPWPKGNPIGVMLAKDKAAVMVEYGGRSATSARQFWQVGRTLADAALNVMRHYDMIAGTACYAAVRHKGVQQAMLAPASGLFVPEPDIDFQVPMETGDKIASIYGIYGDKLADLTAPASGMIFGLRNLPAVTTGEWCCFFAKIDGVWAD